MPGVLVFTATFNEVGNIEAWVRGAHRAVPNADLLVVDDASPDGTGKLLDDLAEEFSCLHVMHRMGKLGLASAHLAAMTYAQENNYPLLVTMDADGSHQTWQIPALLEAATELDFVIGTRYRGGKHRAAVPRRILSLGANSLARVLLPTGLSEYTTSFRVFNERARRVVLDASLQDDGYGFFLEVIEAVHQAGLRTGEVPIEFVDRVYGSSKIPRTQILKSMGVLTQLSRRRLRHGTRRVPANSHRRVSE